MSQSKPALSNLADLSLLALAAKKAFRFSHRHSWYHDRSDSIAFLARMSFHVRKLSGDLADGNYQPGPKFMFAAPKRVEYSDGQQEFIYRPMCFNAFRDQVLEIALLTLFANHFEPVWGDIAGSEYPEVVSYGNRLHLVGKGAERQFSAGNANLYRDWSDDYAKFVRDTEHFFNRTMRKLKEHERVTLICTDIRSFYPSVNRTRLIKILKSKAQRSLRPVIDAVFGSYEVELSDGCPSEFSALRDHGLPQGPAHSGFWANVYLEEFDQWVRDELPSALRDAGCPCSLEFYARYVDDMRFVFRSSKDTADALFEKAIQILSKELNGLDLELSTDKTSRIAWDSTENLLSTGQIAERMQSITRRAYFPLPPEDLDELAKEVRLLFHTNTEVAVKGAGDSQQVLDNPGVRADSRRRFSANKWAAIARDMESMSTGWKKRNAVFAQELVRVWLEDPGQMQLLHRALEIGVQNPEIRRVLKRLDGLKTDDQSLGYYAFALAYLLDCASYSGQPINFKAWPLESLARGVSKENRKHRVLIGKAQQYLLRRGRPLIRVEQLLPNEIENNAWILRRRLEGHAHEECFLDETEEAAILVGLNGRPQILTRQFDELYQLKTRAGKRKLTRSLLQRQTTLACELAKKHRVEIFELSAFEPLPSSVEGEARPLQLAIRAGAYRSPLHWFQLGRQLTELTKSRANRRMIREGFLNPFALVVGDDGGISFSDLPRRMVAFIGYRKQPDGGFLSTNTRSWALPIGLILRAAGTGRAIDLLGMSASARFGLAGTFNSMLRAGAKLPKATGDILDKLFAWPGSLIPGYRSVGAFAHDMRLLEKHVQSCSAGGKSICDVPRLSDQGNARPSPRFNLVICQVPSYPRKVDDAAIRRALSIANMVARQKGNDATPLDLIVFPELSLPVASIRTLCRFVRQTGAMVLAGLELRASLDGSKHLNELMWIVPLDDEREHFAILTQEKIHVTQDEKNLNPPVAEANPAVIWRVDTPKGRLSAINCYEFTDLLIRDLLRGRVEALVIAANNQDVTTFDNLVESTQYDLFSHVILVNAEKHGGSAVRAPYRKSYERRIFDIHGKDLFATNVCSINLSDFRPGNSESVKKRPAGFEIRP